MENNKLALSSQQLDSVILDLYNQIDTITTTLNSIKEKFYNISEYFTGSVGDEYQAKYAAYASKMNLIKDNLNTYIKDLMIVRNVFTEVDKKTAEKVAMVTEATQREAKQLVESATVGDLTIHE